MVAAVLLFAFAITIILDVIFIGLMFCLEKILAVITGR